MRRPPPALIGLALAAVAGGGLLWWADPFDDGRPWAPTCTDLAPRMQTATGGSWSVTEPDRNRDRNQASTICVVAFAAGDQRYTGELQLFAFGEPDPEKARDEVTNGRCSGAVYPSELPAGYLAFRACAYATGEKAVDIVLAAKDERWVTVRVSVNVRDDADGAMAHARSVARTAAAETLNLPGPDEES